MENNKSWHAKHKDESKFGEWLADSVATGMGSWRFIIIQTIIVAVWMIANVIGFMYHWDVYPFILLNLLFSTQAAYAASIIMMAHYLVEYKIKKKSFKGILMPQKRTKT